MILLVIAAAFGASLLTLFSGFGLGTLLMPVYALAYPIDVAVALTAVVHLMNNVFKFVLLGKGADRRVVLAFGLPAVVTALLGAWLLVSLQAMPPLAVYQGWGGRAFQIMPVKLAVAAVMLTFAALELSPWFGRLTLDRKCLPWGGVLSGFFGGLSGHQGALRSAFLVKCGLGKEAFIATGVVISCMVDITRLAVYSGHFARIGLAQHGGVLALSVAAAYAGVVLGRRLIAKVTVPVIQRLVAVMLALIAVLLGAGVI